MSDHPDDCSYAAKSVGIPETKIRERRPAQHNHASWHRSSPAETISRSTRELPASVLAWPWMMISRRLRYRQDQSVYRGFRPRPEHWSGTAKEGC